MLKWPHRCRWFDSLPWVDEVADKGDMQVEMIGQQGKEVMQAEWRVLALSMMHGKEWRQYHT